MKIIFDDVTHTINFRMMYKPKVSLVGGKPDVLLERAVFLPEEGGELKSVRAIFLLEEGGELKSVRAVFLLEEGGEFTYIFPI